MTDNAKIAAYFNIPYCEHDWSGTVTITGVATTDITLSTCVHCGAYEDGDWDEPIDFATDSGFFVLLDALKKKKLSCGLHSGESRSVVNIWAFGDASRPVVSPTRSDLKTALVAATLEFIEREQTK